MTTKHHQSIFVAGVIAVGLLVSILPIPVLAGEDTLPPAALKALQGTFPGAIVKESESDTEKGVRYYEADLKWQGHSLEVEVTADGAIGETQEDIQLSALPQIMAKGLVNVVDTKKVHKVEKHVVYGVPRNGTFSQLAEPETFYEVKARDSLGKKLELCLDSAGKLLVDDDDDDDEADDEHEDDDDD